MSNPHTINIHGRPIGIAHPPYVIAELSANHNGQFDNAIKLIDVARAAGADAAGGMTRGGKLSGCGVDIGFSCTAWTGGITRAFGTGWDTVGILIVAGAGAG